MIIIIKWGELTVHNQLPVGFGGSVLSQHQVLCISEIFGQRVKKSPLHQWNLWSEVEKKRPECELKFFGSSGQRQCYLQSIDGQFLKSSPTRSTDPLHVACELLLQLLLLLQSHEAGSRLHSLLLLRELPENTQCQDKNPSLDPRSYSKILYSWEGLRIKDLHILNTQILKDRELAGQEDQRQPPIQRDSRDSNRQQNRAFKLANSANRVQRSLIPIN